MGMGDSLLGFSHSTVDNFCAQAAEIVRVTPSNATQNGRLRNFRQKNTMVLAHFPSNPPLTPHGHPKPPDASQMPPRWFPEAPQMPPDVPRWLTKPSKMAPTSPRCFSDGSQIASRWLPEASQMPQMLPRGLPEVPDNPRCLPDAPSYT